MSIANILKVAAVAALAVGGVVLAKRAVVKKVTAVGNMLKESNVSIIEDLLKQVDEIVAKENIELTEEDKMELTAWRKVTVADSMEALVSVANQLGCKLTRFKAIERNHLADDIKVLVKEFGKMIAEGKLVPNEYLDAQLKEAVVVSEVADNFDMLVMYKKSLTTTMAAIDSIKPAKPAK